MVNYLDKYTWYTIDLETTTEGYNKSPSAQYRNNEVLACCCYVDENELKYPDDYPFAWPEIAHLDSLDRVQEYLECEDDPGDVLIIGHNLKFDLAYLMRDMPHLPWHKYNYWCTQTAEYLLSGHSSTWTSLEMLCRAHGKEYDKRLNLDEYLNKLGKSMRDIPLEELNKYVQEDVEATEFLFKRQSEGLSQETIDFVISHCNKIPALTSIELNGMYYDTEKVPDMILENDLEMSRLQQVLLDDVIALNVFTSSGSTNLKTDIEEQKHIKNFLNITSNKTVSAILTGYPNILKIGTRKADKRSLAIVNPFLNKHDLKTIYDEVPTDPSATLSVDTEQLKKIKHHATVHSFEVYTEDFVEKVEKFRDLQKTTNTYLGKLHKAAKFTPEGKIYSNFHMTSTVTGRLSSSEPNFQNMPSHIRELFFADGTLVELDFKQLELCVLAQISNCRKMRDDIINNVDIHYEIGKRVMCWSSPADMTDSTRRIVKGVVFGVCYGGGAARLAKQGNIPESLAANIIKSFFERYPEVKTWYAKVQKSVNSLKEPFGFHPDGTQKYKSTYRTSSFSDDIKERFWSFVEEPTPDFIKEPYGFSPTKMKNYPVQGIAGGDIVLSFLKILYYILGGESSKVRIVNTVHDSIVLSVPEGFVMELEKVVVPATIEYLSKRLALTVPLTVNVKTKYTSRWS